MSISTSDIIFIVFVGLLLLASVISNSLVIFIVWRNKKMRNVTNILICNLSVSDIILAGVILPQNLHDLSHEDEFHEGVVLCKIAFAFPILCITTASYTLACMAYERRNCIVDSLQRQITLKHCKIIIPCIWIVAFIIVTPTLVEFNVVEVQNENLTDGHSLACNSDLVPHAFAVSNGIMLCIVTYLIPLFIILYNYAKIIHFVIKQTKANSQQQTSVTTISNTTILKKRMKIIKMLIIVAALFAISWLPYFITLMIGKITGTDGSADISSPISLFKIFLAAFSTSYNVILYVIFNQMFRQAFQDILCYINRTNKVGATTTGDHDNNVSTLKTDLPDRSVGQQQSMYEED